MNIFKEGIYFFNELASKKFQILELTKRDFKQRYTGSFMGLLWAFLEPLAFIAILSTALMHEIFVAENMAPGKANSAPPYKIHVKDKE